MSQNHTATDLQANEDTRYADCAWRKSSLCGSTTCVEFAQVENGTKIAIRDSKNPDKDPLVFTPAEWEAFAEGVKKGEFDL